MQDEQGGYECMYSLWHDDWFESNVEILIYFLFTNFEEKKRWRKMKCLFIMVKSVMERAREVINKSRNVEVFQF